MSATAVTADLGRGELEVTTLSGCVCLPWSPSGNLPLRSRSARRIVLRGTNTASSSDLLSLLREARRVLGEGGLVSISHSDARRCGASLGTGPAGLDRMARYTGLAQPATGSSDEEWVLERPASPPPDPSALVSILVPGYRPDFLHSALASAASQTWPHVEILVGDDSDGERLRPFVEEFAAGDNRVRYIGQAGERGGRANMLHLLSEARGTFVKFLNDDDVLDVRCVERMALCLIEHPDVTLVTSHRQPIDARGRPLPDLRATLRRVPVDALIDGAAAAWDLLDRGYNWIGEPTTTMFRRSSLDTPVPFGVGDEPATSSGDLALWLKLLSRGDLLYLTDSLSFFRQHDGQRQKSCEFRAIAAAGLEATMETAIGLGLGEPRGHHFSQQALELRPWWTPDVRAMVRDLDLATAEETLTRLDAHLPQDTTPAILRAQVALASDAPHTAVEVLDAAVSIDPDNVAALKLLSVALLHLGATVTARRVIQRAHDLCPDDADSAALLAALPDLEGTSSFA